VPIRLTLQAGKNFAGLPILIEWASKCMFDRFTAWAHTMSDMRQGNAQVGGAEPVNAGGA